MKLKTIDFRATGLNIKKLRLKSKMTVKEVADNLMLDSVQSIYKWESGKSIPTLDNLILLSGLYNTTIDSIIKVR